MNTLANSKHCHSDHNATSPLCQLLLCAIGNLKIRLRRQLEQRHPGHRQIIHQAMAEAEQLAWQTSFPHLFLPELTELRFAKIIAAREPALPLAA